MFFATVLLAVVSLALVIALLIGKITADETNDHDPGPR